MGLPEQPVEDIQLNDIKLEFPGGMFHKHSLPVPEYVSIYPEIGYYGILPASCVYLRHVKNITFDDFTSSLTMEDYRPPFVSDHTADLQMQNIILPVSGKRT